MDIELGSYELDANQKPILPKVAMDIFDLMANYSSGAQPTIRTLETRDKKKHTFLYNGQNVYVLSVNLIPKTQ